MKPHLFAPNRARVHEFLPAGNKRGMPIGIASSQVELFDNVAYSLADALSQLGHAPRMLRDGDLAAL